MKFTLFSAGPCALFSLVVLCSFIAVLSLPAQPSIGDTVEVPFNFPIVEIKEVDGAELTAVVAAGRAHGVLPGSEVRVLSVYSEEYPERGGIFVGRGGVTAVNDSTTIVRIVSDGSGLPDGEIRVGDLVALPVRVPSGAYGSILFDLIRFNISFINEEGRLYYSFDDIRRSVYGGENARQEAVLSSVRDAVRESTAYLRTIPDPDSSLAELMTGGRFRGMNLLDAMEGSTTEDIRSFLRYVLAYPGKYMGNSWGPVKTYATWIFNNAPVAQDDLRDRLMAAETEGERDTLLEIYREDIAGGLFLYDWIGTAERWVLDGYVDRGERLNAITAKEARLQNDQVVFSWTLFIGARVAEARMQYRQAAELYRDAADHFRETDSEDGLAASLNNLGSALNSMGRYEEALAVYDTVYALKVERESTPENIESLGHTAAGRGAVLSGMGRNREALEAYDLASRLYDSAGTVDFAGNTAWALARAGTVLNRMGEYDGALNRLENAIAIYRKIGDQGGEADVLDEIAYQYSSMGRNQEALRNYEKAYELHLALGDKKGAGFSRSNAGQMYWGLGDYREAEKSHRMAILLREEADDLPGQAYSWHKLGEMFRESGDPNAALEVFDKAAEIYRMLGDRARQAEVLNSSGDVYYGQKSWRAALERYDNALAVQREAGAQDGEALTLYNIGNVYFDDKKYEKAKESFEESLRIRERIGDKNNAVYNITGLGLVAWSLHDYAEAKRLFNRAMALAEEVNSRLDIAWCRLVIARVESQKGESVSAMENFLEALRIYRDLGDKSGEVEALLGIGGLNVEQGKFDEGLTRYNEAHRIAAQTNNRTGMGSALTAIASVHLLLGDFERGLEADSQSLAVSREVGNPWGVASAYIGLGNTRNAMGEFRQAVDYYRRADSVYRELGDTLARSTPMNNTGTVYFFQGDYERALDQFNQVLQILRSTGQEDESLAIAVSNIGEVYYEQGRLGDAEQWLLQALEIEEKIGARRMIASTTTILAQTMLRAGRLEESEVWGMRALTLTTEIGEPEQLADINGVMGELALRRALLPDAERYLTAAVDISGRIGSTKYLWRPLYFLGILHRDRGDRAGAIAHLARSVETIEKLRDKVAGGEAAQKLFASDRTKVGVYEALIALLIEEGEIEKGLGYLERSSSEDLRARFKGLEPSFADPEKRELLEKGREMKARIDQLAGRIAAERGGEGEKIERLQEIISVAESDYIRFVNETIREQPELRNYFSAGVNPIELRRRKQKIPRDVAVVSYLIGEGQVFAFVATADTVVARVIPVPRADVEWKVRSFCRAVERPDGDDDVRRGSAELYDLLLAPIEDRIAGYDKLAIIPSGDLSYLPFGALRGGGEADRYLMERYALFYISDLGVFLSEETEGNDLRVIAFGNADGTLPSAEKEVDDIAALYPGAKVYLRNEATEERAKNIPQGYNVLHFATHGNLDYRRFENSWLTLAPTPAVGDDGRLTLEEVWGISNLADCRLVTLSACNTAVSEDVVEGWPINPANAFLQVGVPRVVATLWQVDDAATAVLMREFYRNLSDHGAADALQRAQQTLAADADYSSPYYWGPFVLLGDWR